jgi:hypothetical protein
MKIIVSALAAAVLAAFAIVAGNSVALADGCPYAERVNFHCYPGVETPPVYHAPVIRHTVPRVVHRPVVVYRPPVIVRRPPVWQIPHQVVEEARVRNMCCDHHNGAFIECPPGYASGSVVVGRVYTGVPAYSWH